VEGAESSELVGLDASFESLEKEKNVLLLEQNLTDHERQKASIIVEKERLTQLEAHATELEQKKCANPSCYNDASMKCSRCKCVSYCGSDCQKIHWKSHHKKFCVVSTKEQERIIERTRQIDELMAESQRIQHAMASGGDVTLLIKELEAVSDKMDRLLKEKAGGKKTRKYSRRKLFKKTRRLK